MLSRFKALVILFSISIFAQNALAKNICASCYWDTKCGSISTEDVVELSLVNENERYQGEQYAYFLCDNGRKKLGLLWSDKPCSQIGGLSGLELADYVEMLEDKKCKFGN